MAFTGWDSYVPLLDALALQRDRWDSAKDFADFDSRLRLSCSELVGGATCTVGEFGYEALLKALRAELLDDELVFRQIRLAALAWPALDYGLGEEWSGYFISERLDGTEVYAESRFAEESGWEKLEVSSLALSLDYDEQTGLMRYGSDWYLKDGKTQVWPDESYPGAFKDSDGNVYIKGELQADTVTDLRQQHYDIESERWRRFNEEAEEFEYYHDNDGVWERFKDGYFYRLHSSAYGWLAYDEESGLWLDTVIADPQWRSRDEIGQPSVAVLDESEFEQDEVLDELDEEELDKGYEADEDEPIDEAVEMMREQLLAEALEVGRSAGLVPDLISEADWTEYIDGLVLQELQA